MLITLRTINIRTLELECWHCMHKVHNWLKRFLAFERSGVCRNKYVVWRGNLLASLIFCNRICQIH